MIAAVSRLKPRAYRIPGIRGSPTLVLDAPSLTYRQGQVLVFVAAYIAAHEYPPTMREIGEYLGTTLTNAVKHHLLALRRKGWLTVDPATARGLRLVRPLQWVQVEEKSPC